MKYGVINKITGEKVGTYSDIAPNYSDPFGPQSSVVHFIINAGEYLDGYSLDASYVPSYDSNYVPSTGTYVFAKRNEFSSIQDGFEIFLQDFAAHNSELLNAEIARLAGLALLNPTDPVALATFVKSKLDPLVDALKPLFQDIKMNYFWRVEQYIALVPREDVLASDARMTQCQADLLVIVRP